MNDIFNRNATLSVVTNNQDIFLHGLKQLGLNVDEARIYVELLKEPATHLKLSRATGINRSKVYRLVEDLVKRSLITIRSDDLGTFLVAADPSTLEVELITNEERIKSQRATLSRLVPLLTSIKSGESREFIVHTYEGEQGFKQMLWHELKTRGEIVIFGSGTIHDLVAQVRWAGKFYEHAAEAGYTIRELLNPNDEMDPFLVNLKRIDRFKHRSISSNIVPLKSQISIYNDTVATYHWREKQKVGLEIINKDYAQMQRKVFEHYWQIAE